MFYKNLFLTILIFASTTVFTACTESKLPKYNLVNSLRILAMKSTAPEVSIGDAIPVVSALVLDPDGAGRTITYTWVGCRELPTSSSTRFQCVDAPDKISLGSATTSNAGAETIALTMLALVSAAQAHNGVNYIVSLTVTAGSETVTAFKRIVVTSKATKNNNPSVTALTRNTVTLADNDLIGTGTVTLEATIPSASYENYTFMDALNNTRNVQEDILITWFQTEGTMEATRTFSGDKNNQWTAPAPKTRSLVQLTVVLHDGRGGTDWKTIILQ
ncbi:MAG: hypothetical protein SGI74_04540 [Oligoflexia bacterium]|nr:hypothetical protein [Oligoflexia bacterium]